MFRLARTRFTSLAVALGLATLVLSGLAGLAPVDHAAADTFVNVCPLCAAKDRITSGLLPDLTVRDVTIVDQDGQSYLKFTMANLGLRASGPFQVEFRPLYAQLPFAAFLSSGLGPGTSKIAYILRPLPSCGFVGFVTIDPANTVAESDETNNQDYVAIRC